MAKYATLSVVYDAQQDRLKLLLVSKQAEPVVGVMTRRLFKGVLSQLPLWLEKQVAVPASSMRPRQPGDSLQQDMLSSFEHLSACQEPQEKIEVNVKVGQPADEFVIESANFSIKEVGASGARLVQLRFISASRDNNINLSLTKTQLHKLVGMMLDKCEGWDLVNPWAGALSMHCDSAALLGALH